MIRVIGGRGVGKTGQLLLIAKEHNATLVCSNPRAMKAKAEAYGITGIPFVSYEDAVDHMRAFDTREDNYKQYNYIVIDEIEAFIQEALGNHGKLIGYTLSNED